jgi:hypothetical protein
VLTLAIHNVAQKEEVALKSCEDVAGAGRTQPQSTACDVWSLRFWDLSINL